MHYFYLRIGTYVVIYIYSWLCQTLCVYWLSVKIVIDNVVMAACYYEFTGFWLTPHRNIHVKLKEFSSFKCKLVPYHISRVDKASSYEIFVLIYLTYAYTTYASVTIGLRWANSLLFEVKLISEKKTSIDMEEIRSRRERSTWSKSS